jgi:hypothetical protein
MKRLCLCTLPGAVFVVVVAGGRLWQFMRKPSHSQQGVCPSLVDGECWEPVKLKFSEYDSVAAGSSQAKSDAEALNNRLSIGKTKWGCC